jgi:hypothetical protein
MAAHFEIANKFHDMETIVHSAHGPGRLPAFARYFVAGSMKKLAQFSIDTVNKRLVLMHSGQVLRPPWECLCARRPATETCAARSQARMAVDREWER